VGEVRISADYGHLHIEVVDGNVPAAIAEFERLEGWLLEREWGDGGRTGRS
jgi:hypothetical protein